MIWDASDANPMHRRIPAEVVSRRARAPPKRPQVQEKEKESEEVTVDLKAAIMLKPEARPRWLMRAFKMVSEGRASSTELYNIIVSRKFASGLPERVGRRLVSIVEDSVDLFSEKQKRYLNSSDCPLMAHLRRSDAAGEGAPVEAAQRREKERPREEEQGAAKWQAAQDEAALRRQVADAKAHARREAARREEKQRQQDAEEEAAKRQAAEEAAARRRKLEEEADDIFAKAIVPVGTAASGTRARSRSNSAKPRSGGSRSISSRTARRRARSNRHSNRRPDWTSNARESGALTGSRALLLNRDYMEDLPHLPRPSSGGPPVAPVRFGSRSRSRDKRFRR